MTLEHQAVRQAKFPSVSQSIGGNASAPMPAFAVASSCFRRWMPILPKASSGVCINMKVTTRGYFFLSLKPLVSLLHLMSSCTGQHALHSHWDACHEKLPDPSCPSGIILMTCLVPHMPVPRISGLARQPCRAVWVHLLAQAQCFFSVSACAQHSTVTVLPVPDIKTFGRRASLVWRTRAFWSAQCANDDDIARSMGMDAHDVKMNSIRAGVEVSCSHPRAAHMLVTRCFTLRWFALIASWEIGPVHPPQGTSVV
ncbi:hypothetical protein WJX74_001352 [Apatococcus lobatus]|uniref:Uncharacterized protein n=1 Tax=Apatococcus lobatus TaxID=904363 RepID=A0AAW1RL17_9CHLO